ncbi:MAG: DUF1385 domain-containing protein [Anaerolineales bacterium]|nr:DUF1385 domain-containing protein [Anaerolineales bacterium]
MTEKLPVYGGQAVIEGVMMRGAKAHAIAVRAPDQSIVIKTEELGALYKSHFARTPLIRGLFILWDALVLGVQALTFSANVQAEEEDEKIEGGTLLLTLLTSLSLGVVVFFLLPAGVGYLVERIFQWSGFWSNVAEGFTRLVLLIGYIWVIGFVPDIERVFGYHGAEHKTINAFEAGAPLTPESVAEFSREHPRCGTAFLLTLVIFSILLFSALGSQTLLMRLLTRILLIPVLAALAYEYLRLSARLIRYRWARVLIAPNLWLQRLTTREPSLDMLEVSIASFKAMLEKEQDGQPAARAGA